MRTSEVVHIMERDLEEATTKIASMQERNSRLVERAQGLFMELREARERLATHVATSHGTSRLLQAVIVAAQDAAIDIAGIRNPSEPARALVAAVEEAKDDVAEVRQIYAESLKVVDDEPF